MNKLLSVLVAAMFTMVSVNALAMKHMGAEKKKGPSATACKKNPKLKGCKEKHETMDKETHEKTEKHK